MSTTLARSGLGSAEATRRLRVLLYGPFGSAKTVNAHKMPRTRTLDFDDGMQSVEWAIRKGIINKSLDEIVYSTIKENYSVKGHVARSTALDRASDQIDEWLDEEEIPSDKWEEHCKKQHGFVYPQHWDTLIVDSGSTLSDIAVWKALDETNRLNLSKSRTLTKPGGLTAMRMQDWGGASSLVQKFIAGLLTLDKNLVFICHEYQNTDSNGNLVAVEPLLIGQLRQKMGNQFDEVWYASVTGSRKNPKFLFQTSPDPRKRLRSRLGCLEAEEEADFDKIRKKVADFYGIDENLLWTSAR